MSNVKRIQIIPSQIDRPASQEGVTLTGTYSNLPYNKNAIKRLQAIVGDNFEGDLNIFDNEENILTALPLEKLQQLLTQVLIRFDNDPDYYTKQDYYYLLRYLCDILLQIDSLKKSNLGFNDQLSTILNEITELQNLLDIKQDKEDQSLSTTSKTIVGSINELKSSIDSTVDKINFVEGSVSKNTEQITLVWDAIENSNPAYTEGSGIDIKDGEISAVTDYDINVTIPVGGFEEPQTITAGTDITTILKKLLEVVVGVKAVNPSITLESKNTTKEYGTRIPTQQIGFTLTQGYFEPADSKWNGARQYMDCAMESVSVSGVSTFVDSIDGYAEIPEQILTKVQEYKITANTVSANTVVPNDSNGNPIPGEKGFTGGSVKTYGTTTFTPYYNAFIGGVDVESIAELTSDNIRSVTAHQLSVTPTAKTLLNGQPTSNNAKKAILIACPSVYKLISVQSELGTDMTDSFDLKGSVNVKCGEQSIPYNCYLCVVYGECKFQTVKLGKA